jgi:rhamnogalacturonyl hydrolase YesR
MHIDKHLQLGALHGKLEQFWQLTAEKALRLEQEYDTSQGSPVFTVDGKYTTRGWTEWTQGFQYGIPLLAFNAMRDDKLLQLGRKNTMQNMAHHISHFGVHDHGFNNLSTFGNLLRLAKQGYFDAAEHEKQYYILALKLSGAVQAKRWTAIKDGGYMYSFNGPHSLFIDTIRTCRILVASHLLGHRMLDENDLEIDLLQRAITHAVTSARFSVYYGEGRDAYDMWGRVAHESIFNINDGNYRCPNAQQGFSGFTTWTRGLAWAMTGFTEFLEFLQVNSAGDHDLSEVKDILLKAARATCDFYIEHTAADGIPYWDTGAPLLHKLGDYTRMDADPYNDFEPVDSSAAAIGAQGLLRLGSLLQQTDSQAAENYFQAGVTVLNTLLSEPYLSTQPEHEGLLLHSVYHRPNGWDHVPPGSNVPNGESSMWGDYHMAEVCLLANKIIEGEYYTFFETI